MGQNGICLVSVCLYINIYIYVYVQWEFQNPKMKVLQHKRPYFVGISPYIGLIWYICIYGRYLEVRFLKWPFTHTYIYICILCIYVYIHNMCIYIYTYMYVGIDISRYLSWHGHFPWWSCWNHQLLHSWQGDYSALELRKAGFSAKELKQGLKERCHLG